MRNSLNKQETRIVSTVWITYAMFYLGRVNVSVVLPALAIALDASRAEVGALGTVYFWVYGIGHLISGEISSHVSPFRMVSLGLLGIALINFAFAFQTSLVVMLLLWGLNGIAQSAGWSPMLRILAERLDRSHIRSVSTIMPFSYVFGTVVTWTLVGAVAGGGDWRIAFWLPALLLLLVLAFWRNAGIDAPKTPSAGFRFSIIIAEARGIAFALLTAALAGFAFNGTIIWLPTFVLDTGLVDASAVGVVAALTQVIAFAGLILVRWHVARNSQVFVTTAAMLAGAGFAFLLLTVIDGAAAILIVAFALMMLNGGFGLVVSALPLLLAPPGRASATTGSINMMTTFFGGMAGFTIGGLVEISGWGAAFGLWGGALLLAAFVIWRQRALEKREPQKA